jgi:hypothetical protein
VIHTSSAIVTFAAPFTLPGLERSYPAGNYRIDTDMEQLDLSFAASRRVATTIMLTAGAVTEAWPVDPTDLAAALAKDIAARA